MDKIDIVVASVDDREYIHQCIEIAKEQQPSGVFSLTSIELAKFVICARQNGKVIGFVSLMENVLELKDLYIDQIVVKGEYKGTGLGATMLEYVKKHSLGHEKITTNVRRKDDGLMKFYHRLGFKQEEGRFDYYEFKLNTSEMEDNQSLTYTDFDIENE